MRRTTRDPSRIRRGADQRPDQRRRHRAANSNPPNQLRPQIFYGTMDTFLSSTGVLFPYSVTGFEWDQKVPTVHSWTLGVQRDLGFGVLLDLARFKNIPFGSRGRQLQFRWKAYNVFNHTQYASVDTTARFNPAGQQINMTFGQVTSTRPPRQMQALLRIQF